MKKMAEKKINSKKSAPIKKIFVNASILYTYNTFSVEFLKSP